MASETDFDDFDFEKGEPVEAQRWDRVEFCSTFMTSFGPVSVNHWARVPSRIPSQGLVLCFRDGPPHAVQVVRRYPDTKPETTTPYNYPGN